MDERLECQELTSVVFDTKMREGISYATRVIVPRAPSAFENPCGTANDTPLYTHSSPQVLLAGGGGGGTYGLSVSLPVPQDFPARALRSLCLTLR